ncbi:hypothetical protein GCM10009641_49500 [Mycobacterium cookii]|uniref:Secreted protein n=1 Tax=Mycobacterium cookii TaxID=1775 RepID=A0A7I7KX34_9MYCO|nr:hypothetical protein [Mycobacterium cookii]MCV7332217.1 hypothetical protein [Mycobacterium cookii]BBX46364.1 hypothetical protein MCOO_23790 [Mycobacterium cookii]
MTTIGKGTIAIAALSAASALVAVPARADDPPMHEVKYVITAASPIWADIYYLDQDPGKFSNYSHNPYQFTPNVQADIAPGHPWVSPPVMLANPDQYAMVAVSTGTEPGTPMFHCALIVDGVVKASQDGPKGALCSLRNW